MNEEKIKKRIQVILSKGTFDYLRKAAFQEQTTMTNIVEESIELRRNIKSPKK